MPSTFTPCQIRTVNLLQRGYELRHPLTGCGVCFLQDELRRFRSVKILVGTFNALKEANLLKLKSSDYPFEVWVLA
jgi:hypothetical protein